MLPGDSCGQAGVKINAISGETEISPSPPRAQNLALGDSHHATTDAEQWDQ